jgi:hypothetical protein
MIETVQKSVSFTENTSSPIELPEAYMSTENLKTRIKQIGPSLLVFAHLK